MTPPYNLTARKLLQLACFISAGAIILGILVWPVLGRATQPAHLCEVAAQRAATRHGVPLDVLRAVALVETGRTRAGQLEPWPWAIHATGRGHWFGTRADARAHARASLDAGYRNIDLGCFQINYRWHGQNFSSVDAMLDPAQNADYAARLLAQHKARLGAWDLAAGAYHSATPQHAQRYMARFRAMRARTSTQAQTAPPPSRTNPYAVLAPADGAHMGSLVPINGLGHSRRLIDLAQGRP